MSFSKKTTMKTKFLLLFLLFVTLSSCDNFPPKGGIQSADTSKVDTIHAGTLRSVHFGINSYSEKAYGFNIQTLSSCHLDAYDMSYLCNPANAKVFTNEEATKSQFYKSISALAATSMPGDTIVVTLSGHGTHFTDPNGEEVDGQNEGSCFYDGIIWDNFIKNAFSKIRAGVIVFTFWDTCHSGTGTRAPVNTPYGFKAKSIGLTNSQLKAFRPKIQPPETDIKFIWLHFGAAQDAEYALDGPHNGNFTDFLKQTLKRRTSLGLDLNAKMVLLETAGAINGQHPNLDVVSATPLQAETINLPSRFKKSLNFKR